MQLPVTVLPFKVDTAADNMADDLLLLESTAYQPALYLRHYGWTEPCYTFGYSQRLDFINTHAPSEVSGVRRATGGGIVDHCNDYTYTVVAVRGHPLCDARATDSYCIVHKALHVALAQVGASSQLKMPCETDTPHAPTVCFQSPEVFDLVTPQSSEKIAGAAQKRTRDGLLIQGSVEKSLAAEAAHEDFTQRFAESLAQAFETTVEYAEAFPLFPQERDRYWRETFRSAKWNERR